MSNFLQGKLQYHAIEYTRLLFHLQQEHYKQHKSTQLRGTATFPAGSLTTTITVKFVKGNHYQMVFWAQSPQAADNGVYNISDLRAVKVNYANAKSNDEYRDAFYAYVEPFQVTQSFTQEVTLHRPFAQINFGTSDLAYALHVFSVLPASTSSLPFSISYLLACL